MKFVAAASLILTVISAHAAPSAMEYLQASETRYLMILTKNPPAKTAEVLLCQEGFLRHDAKPTRAAEFVVLAGSVKEKDYSMRVEIQVTVRDEKSAVAGKFTLLGSYIPTGAKAGSTLFNLQLSPKSANFQDSIHLSGLASEDQHTSSSVTNDSGTMANFGATLMLNPTTDCAALKAAINKRW